MASPLRRGPTDPSRPAGLLTAGGSQRRGPWVALGMLVVFGSALAFAMWATSLGERTAVVTAARDIPAGATIELDDLATLDAAFDGPALVVPARSAPGLVGQVAVADIESGALISPSEVSDATDVPPGMAVVAATFSPGALPVPGLRAGDRVEVVETAGPLAGTGDPPGDGVATAAVVFAVSDLRDSTGTVSVSLLIDGDAATDVANAASSDRIRLVLVPTQRAAE